MDNIEKLKNLRTFIEAHQVRAGFTRLQKIDEHLATVDAVIAEIEALQKDKARVDWLEQNVFHREKDEWDRRVHGKSVMWVFFAPENVQGSARRILDAAVEKWNKHLATL